MLSARARGSASWLTEAARAEGGGLEDSDFWYQAAVKLLAPLLYAAAATGATITDVVSWVDTCDESDVRTALIQANDPAALQAAAATWYREERAKSSVYTTAETVLAAYADPVVAASADGHRITPARLLDGGAHTLYIVAPSHEQRRLRPLFQTLIASILAAAYERASETGGPIDPALLVVLDEAANIAPLRDVDTLASTPAGQGIQLVSVFQDLAQISARYEGRAATVVNNHRAKVLLSGISDPTTLEFAHRPRVGLERPPPTHLGGEELESAFGIASDGHRRADRLSPIQLRSFRRTGGVYKLATVRVPTGNQRARRSGTLPFHVQKAVPEFLVSCPSEEC